MNAEHFSIDALLKMKHSPVRNYAVPGLTSYLIGNPSPLGTVRLFECEREHQEAIIPHSHRFDFQCWVLRGSVRNRIWHEHHYHSPECDRYAHVTLAYSGEPGQYTTDNGSGWFSYQYQDSVYSAGQCYSMTHDQIHSIYFSRGARVLFFEGPTVSNTSVILQPWVDGLVPTFKVEPWMFQREALAGNQDEKQI